MYARESEYLISLFSDTRPGNVAFINQDEEESPAMVFPLSQRTNLAFRYVEPSEFIYSLNFVSCTLIYSPNRFNASRINAQLPVQPLRAFEEITGRARERERTSFQTFGIRELEFTEGYDCRKNATVPKVPQVTRQVGGYRFHLCVYVCA